MRNCAGEYVQECVTETVIEWASEKAMTGRAGQLVSEGVSGSG